ncbi:hypothetical protein FH972_003063 [Carpinus fangiana]|uniref:Uncharacterized protein n=1 Tax=Carpinus fangiana TaxID=176857 RepID=A0A5N6QJG6_9ROSI|nr:hypothetical protein FH972_003063 [Carpinus fangiana]
MAKAIVLYPTPAIGHLISSVRQTHGTSPSGRSARPEHCYRPTQNAAGRLPDPRRRGSGKTPSCAPQPILYMEKSTNIEKSTKPIHVRRKFETHERKLQRGRDVQMNEMVFHREEKDKRKSIFDLLKRT